MKEINELFKKLGLTVKKIGYKNGNRLVTTDDGDYVIKENKESNIYDYLDSRGFDNYSSLIEKNNKYRIFKYEKDNVHSSDKAIDMIYLLSMLHIKTTTYREVDLDKVKEFYESSIDEIEYLNTYYHKLQDYAENKIYMSPCEYLFIRNASSIYQMLNFSRNYLEKWYNIKISDKKERVVLINNNLKLTNFVEYDKDKFLNWDHSRKDWVSYDFYNFYMNNYLELEMSSLFEIYQSKYKYTKDEELLLYTLLCKLWKVDFMGSNYENTIKVSNLVTYVQKTLSFISKQNKENKETYEKKFTQ